MENDLGKHEECPPVKTVDTLNLILHLNTAVLKTSEPLSPFLGA